MQLIQYTPSDRLPVATIDRVVDDLDRAAIALRLIDFEEQPDSREWQAALAIGEVQLHASDDDYIRAALALPRAVWLVNDLIDDRNVATAE